MSGVDRPEAKAEESEKAPPFKSINELLQPKY